MVRSRIQRTVGSGIASSIAKRAIRPSKRYEPVLSNRFEARDGFVRDIIPPNERSPVHPNLSRFDAGKYKVTTGYLEPSRRMSRIYNVLNYAAKIYTSRPNLDTNAKIMVASIVEKHVDLKDAKASVGATLKLLNAALEDIARSVPFSRDVFLQIFSRYISERSSPKFSGLNRMWNLSLQSAILDDAGQICTKPLLRLQLNSALLKSRCSIRGFSGENEATSAAVWGTVRDPRALARMVLPDPNTVAEVVQEPDFQSVVDEVLLAIDQHIRGRQFSSPAEFLEDVRQEIHSKIRAGSLGRYVDINEVDVGLSRDVLGKSWGKGKGERHTTSKGPDTLGSDSWLTSFDATVPANTAGHRIMVDGKVKLLHARYSYLLKACALPPSAKDKLKPMNQMSIRPYIVRFDRGFPDAQAEFFGAFEQSCASATGNGLAFLLQGLDSASRALNLNAATQLSFAMSNSIAVDKSDRWRVTCHWLTDDYRGWQVGFSQAFEDFHLSISVKDAEPITVKIEFLEIYGTPVVSSEELHSPHENISLALEKNHVIESVMATLVKVSSAMEFDDYNAAPSLLAEAALRTTRFLTPRLQPHRVKLGIIGRPHLTSGNVSVSWSDLDTSSELVRATPTSDGMPTREDTATASVTSKQPSSSEENAVSNRLLVSSSGNPFALVIEPRLQSATVTRATGFDYYGFTIILPKDMHLLNSEAIGLEAAESSDQSRAKMIENTRARIEGLREGDFAALHEFIIQLNSSLGSSADVALRFSHLLRETEAGYESVGKPILKLTVRSSTKPRVGTIPGDPESTGNTSVTYHISFPPMTNLSVGLDDHNSVTKTPAGVAVRISGRLRSADPRSKIPVFDQISAIMRSIAAVLKDCVDGKTYATCSDFTRAAGMALMSGVQFNALPLIIDELAVSGSLREGKHSNDVTCRADFGCSPSLSEGEQPLTGNKRTETELLSPAELSPQFASSDKKRSKVSSAAGATEAGTNELKIPAKDGMPELEIEPDPGRSTEHELPVRNESGPQSALGERECTATKINSSGTEIGDNDFKAAIIQQVSGPRLRPDSGQSTQDKAVPSAGTHETNDLVEPSHGVPRPETQRGVIIALGSNMGDRVEEIERACRAIDEDPDMRIVDTSCLYESEPMYVEDQDRFINGVCEIETSLSPIQLLDRLQAIEQGQGRVKLIDKGPRNIDLDIVLFRDQIIKSERLTVPHELMHEREFVLRPLNDIASVNGTRIVGRNGRLDAALHRMGPAKVQSLTPLGKGLGSIDRSRASRPTAVMSILNTTPDSFSDGGSHSPQDFDSLKAVAASHIAAGASIIDVGGQSSRPNAPDISAHEEISRILPAIKAIKALPEASTIAISIDTYRAAVAQAAVEAGAHIINDISAGQLDKDMFATVAKLGCTYIMMHMRGTPATMTSEENCSYPDGVSMTVMDELSARVNAAVESGIRRWRIITDPGIGFAKTEDQNLELLQTLALTSGWRGHLRRLPMLVGTSRKGFIGRITGVKEPRERTWGTAATVTAAVAGGADIVRVHDVKEMAQVVKMADAIYRRLHGVSQRQRRSVWGKTHNRD